LQDIASRMSDRQKERVARTTCMNLCHTRVHETELIEETKELDSKDLVAKVARLVDLIEYQDGAVVSKTIIDKKTGTVTLFAFDKGQRLSEHTAPFDALVHLLDGRAEITISGKSYNLEHDEMIVMPANEPHALKAPERFKMILTMIK